MRNSTKSQNRWPAIAIAAGATLVIGALAVAVLAPKESDATSSRATGPESTTASRATTVVNEPTAAASATSAVSKPAAGSNKDAGKKQSGRSGAKAVASIDAYRGLGTWVDIYDKRVFDHPEAEVEKMARRGVKTIYIETGNSKQSYAICRPRDQARIIRAAHARKMKVVAWYLPEFVSMKHDYGRIKEAIEFRTSDGQRFDSFALDIESPKVRSVHTRNLRMLELTKRMRKLVGPGYALGAIIPSPYGIEKPRSYWKGFPYRSVSKAYDVILPMTYYSFHFNGGRDVYANMRENMRILRKKGAEKPVHLIGGLGADTNRSEVRAFVRASRDTRCVGASIYDWVTTGSGQWRELKAVKR